MKGKRLYALLKNLDRSERLQLHHQCIKSSDKRHAVLKDLLDSKVDSIESFESVLNKTAVHFENYSDAAKAQRRFIDFASKEIENILIADYLNNKPQEKSFFLAKIFNERNSQELFSHYNESAKVSAEKVNNLWMLSELSDYKIKWLSRGQVKEDMKLLRILLNGKYNLEKDNYFQQLSQYYSTISALYLDDNNVVSDDDLQNIQLELNELTQKSPNPFFKAQFLLASARFNFGAKQKLDNLLNEAEKIISDLTKNESQYERLKRSIYYIRILSGINYGDNLLKLIDFSNEVLRINRKYAYKDSVSYFLNTMFLILNKDLEMALKQRLNFDEIYFDDSNRFYSFFLDALYYFLNENYESALEILNNLSYAESDYVALWSKLMVIKIHSNLGNDRLFKNLLVRMYKYLKDHHSRNFTQKVSVEILNSYKKKNDDKLITNKNKIFDLFELLKV
jgi:hypothetical protein